MEALPSKDHPVWKDLVTGKIKVDFDFLASKVLLMRIAVEIGTNCPAEIIEERVEELRSLFAKNLRNPKVQNDIRRLFR